MVLLRHLHEHAQEVVGEGGEEGPHQRPAQDLAKGKAQAALTEVGQLVKVVPACQNGVPLEIIMIAAPRSFILLR